MNNLPVISSRAPPARLVTNSSNCNLCFSKFNPLIKPRRNCANCGNEICKECCQGKVRRAIRNSLDLVRVCDYCFQYLVIQNLPRDKLASISISRLRNYIEVYGLPAQSVIEKEELVRIISKARPLTVDNELVFRRTLPKHQVGIESWQSKRKMQIQNRREDSDGDGFENIFTDFAQSVTKGWSSLIDELFGPDTETVSTSSFSSSSSPERSTMNGRSTGPNIMNPPEAGTSRTWGWSQQSATGTNRDRQTPPTANHPTGQSYPRFVSGDPAQFFAEAFSSIHPSQYTSHPPPNQQPWFEQTQSRPAPEKSRQPPKPNAPSLAKLLTDKTDVSKLPVSILKSILQNNGVSMPQNLLEKKELVDKVQALLDQAEKERQEELQGANDRDLCKICWDRVANAVLLECGHFASCLECGNALMDTTKECPICRSRITKVVRVFRS